MSDSRTIRAWDGNPLRVPWRVGRKVGRTIYAAPFPDRPSDHDPLIGVMDTPELAEYAVRAHNEEVARGGPLEPWRTVMAKACSTCAGTATQLCECDRGLREPTNCWNCSGRECEACDGTGQAANDESQAEGGTDAV